MAKKKIPFISVGSVIGPYGDVLVEFVQVPGSGNRVRYWAYAMCKACGDEYSGRYSSIYKGIVTCKCRKAMTVKKRKKLRSK